MCLRLNSVATTSLRVSYVELTIDTALPLTCQRSMQRFLLPVKVTQRLGLIRDEDEESSLPEEYEALLVPEDGQLRPLDLVEDELVLAVPVVPLSPDGEAVDKDWAPSEEETKKANPFAALAALKTIAAGLSSAAAAKAKVCWALASCATIRRSKTNRVWSNPMAVQKSRVTPSRRGQRRSHDALSAKRLSTDPTTGEVHLRHHITADGFYRGKKVIQTKTSAVEED